jgi:hypothetical protein
MQKLGISCKPRGLFVAAVDRGALTGPYAPQLLAS